MHMRDNRVYITASWLAKNRADRALTLAVSCNEEVPGWLLQNHTSFVPLKEDLNAALIKAATGGLLDTMSLLADRGADIHANDDEALVAAVSNDRLDDDDDDDDDDSEHGLTERQRACVHELLVRGAIVNARDGMPLLKAIMNQDQATVRMLLDHGANASAQNNNMLMVAVGQGNGAEDIGDKGLEVVCILLDSGVDVNARNGKALRTAVRNVDKEAVSLLLERGAHVNAKDYKALWKAVDLAINGEGCYVLKKLLAHVTSLDVKNRALQMAAREYEGDDDGTLRVIQVLQSVGADVRYNDGFALMTFADYNEVDTVRLMLDGLDRNEESQPLYDNALVAAAHDMTGEGIATLRLLIERGANVRAHDSQALVVASTRGLPEAVQVLVDAGADVRAQGYEPLIAAAKGYSGATVGLLLAKGADVHARDDEALMVATRADIVRVLIANGADVHARNGAVVQHVVDMVGSVFSGDEQDNIMEILQILHVAHVAVDAVHQAFRVKMQEIDRERRETYMMMLNQSQ